MIRDKLQEFFPALGWKPKGRYLYFTRGDGVRLRITLGERSVTVSRIAHGSALRIGGDFYSRIAVLPDERVRIGTLIFGEQNVDGMGSKG